VGVSSLFQ